MSQTVGGPYTGVTVAQAMTDIWNTDLAIMSNHIGTSEPSTMWAGMFWWDTTADFLKIRNEANSAWVELLVPTKRTTIQSQVVSHGTVSASGTVYCGIMPSDATIVRVGVVSSAATTSSTDANDLGWMLQVGAGGASLFSAEPTTFNTITGVGGGNEIGPADTVEWYTADQNANVSAGASIELDIRFNGSFSHSFTRFATCLDFFIRP